MIKSKFPEDKKKWAKPTNGNWMPRSYECCFAVWWWQEKNTDIEEERVSLQNNDWHKDVPSSNFHYIAQNVSSKYVMFDGKIYLLLISWANCAPNHSLQWYSNDDETMTLHVSRDLVYDYDAADDTQPIPYLISTNLDWKKCIWKFNLLMSLSHRNNRNE